MSSRWNIKENLTEYYVQHGVMLTVGSKDDRKVSADISESFTNRALICVQRTVLYSLLWLIKPETMIRVFSFNSAIYLALK